MQFLPRTRLRMVEFVLMAVLASTSALPAFAIEVHRFDIPEEEAAAAIRDFGVQAHVQILVAGEAVSGKKLHAVTGELSTEDGLKRLLIGSGLTHQYVGDRSIALLPTQVTQAQVESSGGANSEKGRKKSSSDPFRVAQVDQGATSSDSSVKKEEDDKGTKSKSAQLEEIVVTGTHIRGATDSASPIRTIDRAQIDAAGVTTVEDLFKSVPENVGGIGVETSQANIPVQGGQQNRGLASGINLRGLGSDATLVLLNGHRLPTASNGYSVDISTIPLAAIDHVDILKDGASSIYGSDAVGGVVNFVTVPKFQGAETALTGGTVTNGGKRDFAFSQLLGTSWSSGSIFGTYTFNSQGALSTADREATIAITRPSDAIPGVKSHSIYVSVHQSLGESLSAQLDLLASDRRTNLVGSFVATNPVSGNDGTDYSVSYKHSNSLVTNGSLSWTLSSDWRLTASGQFAASSLKDQNFDAFDLYPLTLHYKGRQNEADIAADGSVFDLPAGPLRLAVGVSARSERYENVNFFALSRDIRAGYGELFIPIISSQNAIRGAQRLELTVSDRYDHYSGFGGTNNPKYGILFAPHSALTVRAAYSKAFRAPLLAELQRNANDDANALLNFPDAQSPTGNSNQLLLVGGNPNLGPETAQSITAGLDFHPEVMPGLTVSADYFSIDFKNRIAQPDPSGLLAANPAIYGNFIIRNPSAALVNYYASQPWFRSFIGPWTPADVALIGDDRLQNISVVKNRGVDVDAKVVRPLKDGTLTYGLTGTYLLKYNQTVIAGVPSIDLLNTPYYPTRLRLRASTGFILGSWSSTVFANYSNSYTNNLDPTNVVHVGSWMTLDGQISYRLPALNTALQDARLSLSVQNLLDRRPPYVVSFFSGYANYDPVNASILGRYVSLSIKARW